MKREHWPVLARGDFSKGKFCVYCQEPTGAPEHKPGCVMRDRTVIVDVTIRIIRTVPEDWSTDTVEFTEGSWCANNFADELAEHVERYNKAGLCLCGNLSIEFVREATEEDHGQFAFEWDRDENVGNGVGRPSEERG